MRSTLLISVSLAIAAATVVSCKSLSRPVSAQTRTSPTRNAAPDRGIEEWIGVYSSPKEIAGFSGTVLVLETDDGDALSYRMHHYSDALKDLFEQDERYGGCLTTGAELFLPEANGHYDHEKKPQLSASITRYTLLIINGKRVLMRDDALHVYRRQNKLYDYGILIQTNEKPDPLLDLKTVMRPSIKILYNDREKPWRDPFVHGPNAR